MKEKLYEILPFIIPFIGNMENQKHYISYSRVIEAILISIISGVFASYMTVKELQIKFQYLEDTVKKLETKLDAYDNRLYEIERKR